MKKTLLFSMALLLSIGVWSQKLPFQGKLIESGTPVNDTRSFVFEIPSKGWSETHTNVTITDGLYFVVLGNDVPLPDSLFYGVTEQSMTITVGGVALSPVTLYKPISSPFEGSELVVHNDEGTKVGEIAVTDANNAKNGEVIVYGTNGTQNVTLGAISHWQVPGNNDGALYLYNSLGEAKVTMYSTPYRGEFGSGEFSLAGETTGGIHQGFDNYGGSWDFPTITMSSGNGGEVNLNVIESDNVEYGTMRVNSNDGSESSLIPGEVSIKNTDGTVVGSMQARSIGENKNGELNVYGTNGSKNITLGAISHWQTPGNDFGWMYLSDDGGTGKVVLGVTPYRGVSGSAEIHLNGNSAGSIDGLFEQFEGEYSYPSLSFTGHYSRGINLSVKRDGNGDYGSISLLSENGQEKTYNADGVSGTGPLNIYMDVTVNGAVTETSDSRLKKGIRSLENNTLHKIQQLKGVSYNWRVDEFPEKNFSSDRQIGLIAQELEAQFPELVKTNSDGYKSVNYNGFTAVLLEAVKELNEKVEKLEEENTRLKVELSASATNKNEIEQLKTQMQSLMRMVQEQIGEQETTADLLSSDDLK